MKKIILIILMLLFVNIPCFSKNKNPQIKNIFVSDTTEIENEQDNVTLKGYAQYVEDSNVIYLKDDWDHFVLNLKVPQKISSKSLIQKNDNMTVNKPTFSKYSSDEYKISPTNYQLGLSNKNITVGTSYDNDIDYAQFEQTVGLFTKYENKHFALSTSYKKTIGSANGSDTIYVAPELKINKYLSLKEILSTNLTYRREKAEFVISVNPLAHTKENRLKFELGAAQIFDENNSLIKSQIKFNTKFKL